MSYLLKRDVIDQPVINRLDEVRLFSEVIPAGLWPGNSLLIEQTGRFCNANANSRTYTIRLRLNGIQIFTARPPSQTASTLFYAAMQRWELRGVSTNEIHGTMYYSCGGAGTDTGAFAATGAPGGGGTNVWGDINMLPTDPNLIDLTKPVGLEITVQLSHVGATNQFTSTGVFVMFLGDGLSAAVRPNYSDLSYAQGG